MKHGIKALCLALVLGLALAVVGCSRKKEANRPQDLESVRASLREQVARGELTREEAVVRLAEATKEAKFGSGGKDEAKLSPALEALGKELKERVAKGELTAEEAKTAWMEATGKAKGKSNAEGIKDSAKETE
jgi:polyhydroxyalkanoate synthesis regulator phasin